jgi:hypothetical protein
LPSFIDSKGKENLQQSKVHAQLTLKAQRKSEASKESILRAGRIAKTREKPVSAITVRLTKLFLHKSNLNFIKRLEEDRWVSDQNSMFLVF